ncbi:hypothetical protein [Candidatus Nitrospira bockiana]
MTWGSLKERIVTRVFGDVLAARVQQAVQAALTREEPARAEQTLSPFAALQDPSLYGFRRLTGAGQDNPRDLPVMTQERMQQVAYFLYLTNPMAQWSIEMMKDYLLGEGVTLKAEDEATQAVVEAFWSDPVNQWDLKLENKVRELAIYGEQCWPAFVAPGTGRVRLGYLDPCLIDTVVLDPDNAEQAIGVITRKQEGLFNIPERRYRVILDLTEEELMPAAQRLRAQFTDGECFYFAINKVSNGSRGISDLMAKADWLDGYEQFLFQRLERADLANRIVFDLTLQGFTQEQITAFMKGFQLPKPGGVHAHNEKVTLEPKAPDLKASDASVDARLFKHQALAGYPEHWYGGGGDVNRATAGEMDEPTFKRFQSRQKFVKAMVLQTVRYQIRMAKQMGALAQAANETVAVIFPEMVRADLSKVGSIVQQAAAAVSVMLRDTLITKAEARTILTVVVKALGVELKEMSDKELAVLAQDETFRDAAQDYLDRPSGREAPPDPERREPPEETPAEQAALLEEVHAILRSVERRLVSVEARQAAPATAAAPTPPAPAPLPIQVNVETKREPAPATRRHYAIIRDAQGRATAIEATTVQEAG